MKLTKQLGLTNITVILCLHAGLVLLFATTVVAPPLLYALPLVMVIYQRVISEWMHEGAHGNVFPNRAWNDRLLNLLVCPMLFEPIKPHREKHLVHHQRGTYFIVEDPDTEPLIIESKRDFWIAVLHDLSGLTALRQIAKSVTSKPTKKPKKAATLGALKEVVLPFAVLHATIASAIYGLGGSPFIFYGTYLLTLITLYPLLNRIRVYCQHLEILPDGRTKVRESQASRTIDAGLIDRLTFNSRLMIYHTDHHKFPAIHYRALAQKFKPTEDPNLYSRSRWSLFYRLYKGLPDHAAVRVERG